MTVFLDSPVSRALAILYLKSLCNGERHQQPSKSRSLIFETHSDPCHLLRPQISRVIESQKTQKEKTCSK
uniref:Uncharacterized protein n=1 Tax=Rhizophora mucronata TaxID=61149 RepID=A0A2P2PKA4_RHIMU